MEKASEKRFQMGITEVVDCTKNLLATGSPIEITDEFVGLQKVWVEKLILCYEYTKDINNSELIDEIIEHLARTIYEDFPFDRYELWDDVFGSGRLSEDEIEDIMKETQKELISEIGLKLNADGTPKKSQKIELYSEEDNHFYADIIVNGIPLCFLVDTGATSIMLPIHAAAKVGINTDQLIFSGRSATANGEIATAEVNLSIFEFGQFLDRNVTAKITQGGLDEPLLGMSYLKIFENLNFSKGTLSMERYNQKVPLPD